MAGSVDSDLRSGARERRIVETGTVEQLFDGPQHPYTRRLLGAVQRLPGR